MLAKRPLLFCAISCALASARATTTIWIDTDPSIGSPLREVDDAFAVIMAFHSPEIRIAGMSTTFGNAPLARTTEVASDLADRFGAPAGLTRKDVHTGSGSAQDLGKVTGATEALAAVLRKRRKITYVALGPLTNLATLLRLHPELAARIERVIFVGGTAPGAELRFGPGGAVRMHDANVVKDAAAVREVLHTRIPVVIAPIDVALDLSLKAADLRELQASGPAGYFLSRGSTVWLWFWTRVAGRPGGPVFDGLGMITAVRPDLVPMESRFAQVNAINELILAQTPTGGGRRVSVCRRVTPAMKSFLLARLRRRATTN